MRLLRALGILAAVGVGFWAGFWALGILARLVLGTILLGLRLAVLAAIVLGCAWVYRRLRGRRARRSGTAALTRGMDWAFIRGKIDEETYLRHQARRRMK
jgi:membrane protein implicated in regulation of membrane protease activity